MRLFSRITIVKIWKRSVFFQCHLIDDIFSFSIEVNIYRQAPIEHFDFYYSIEQMTAYIHTHSDSRTHIKQKGFEILYFWILLRCCGVGRLFHQKKRHTMGNFLMEKLNPGETEGGLQRRNQLLLKKFLMN